MTPHRIAYSGGIDPAEKRCSVLGDYSKDYATAEDALAAIRSMPTWKNDPHTYWTEETIYPHTTDQAHDIEQDRRATGPRNPEPLRPFTYDPRNQDD